jgi:beta-N-acetylhexosaminidase
MRITSCRFSPLEQSKVAYIQLGTNRETTFEKSLKKYTEVKGIHLPLNFSSQDVARLKQALKNYNRVIIGVFGLSKRRSIQYGLDKVKALSAYLKAADKPSILCLFDNPYALEYIGPDPAVLVAYEKASEAQQAAAMAIFGGLKVDGRLPISAGPAFPAGTGMSIERTTRFGFAFPEEEGVDSRVLNRIDSLAELFIKKGAMPGCAILVGKGNNIIYEKGFGKTHTRSGAEAIDPYYHTYDLASVTKVATTTLIAMKLVEEKRLKLDAPISNYLPELKGTDKAKITVRRLLQHNSGLPAWRPFYRDTYLSPRNPKNDPRFYRTSYQDSFNLPIAPQLFAHYSLPDTIWDWIKGMSVRQSRKVRYSDIGMIMLGKVIEAQTGVPIDRYAHFAYYSPLGMSSTYYTPGLRGLENRCPPTIEDNYWRHGRLQGYVHDETAAILGGRTGHAGLFSNVYDLAKLFFMLKNGGTYGNRQFLRESTILSFTKQQLGDNRKGLGWDKPEIVPGRSNPVSEQASRATFGHTGFTGTCAWVDPEQDLVYIFLSNRTYPSASNRMLNRESVRSKIMDQIYDAIKAYEEKEAS